MKEKAENITTDITKDDEAKGLGDDSNAPNPETLADMKPSLRSGDSKRKREAEVVETALESKPEKEPERRGGHQTKVIRRVPSDDANKAVCTMICSKYSILLTVRSAVCDHKLLQDTREGESGAAGGEEDGSWWEEREKVKYYLVFERML